jgi:glucosamine--fructose-6-phosphate aminotransferase (isomerizing)
MCGIAGYCGNAPALPVILEMLGRLEYRGYDSAGVAVVEPDGSLYLRKEAGKLESLATRCHPEASGMLGIGHTRWATHGKPTATNSHPHCDCKGNVAVVHNGIVENYLELRRGLQARGHKFISETDTEVIPHLIEERMAQGVPFAEAVRLAAN